MEKSPCLKVRKEKGAEAIRLLKQAGLYRPDLKPKRVDRYLLIPVIDAPGEKRSRLRRQLGRIEVVTEELDERSRRPAKLSAMLEGGLSPQLLAHLPKSFDIIGSVAVLELHEELEAFGRQIGDAILKLYPRVRTVLAKSGAVEGQFRVRDYVPLVGGETETLHREHGCAYQLDVAKVYFSPRLAYERARISQQVRDGEVILDMFAGVGPFSILIARNHKAARVYSADINPDAFHYLVRNILINRVVGKVTPALAESGTLIRGNFSSYFDRVVMNLPGEAIQFLDVAIRAIRLGGIIHCYAFAEGVSAMEEVRRRIADELSRLGQRFEFQEGREVKATAPGWFQVVQDVKVL